MEPDFDTMSMTTQLEHAMNNPQSMQLRLMDQKNAAAQQQQQQQQQQPTAQVSGYGSGYGSGSDDTDTDTGVTMEDLQRVSRARRRAGRTGSRDGSRSGSLRRNLRHASARYKHRMASRRVGSMSTASSTSSMSDSGLNMPPLYNNNSGLPPTAGAFPESALCPGYDNSAQTEMQKLDYLEIINDLHVTHGVNKSRDFGVHDDVTILRFEAMRMRRVHERSVSVPRIMSMLYKGCGAAEALSEPTPVELKGYESNMRLHHDDLTGYVGELYDMYGGLHINPWLGLIGILVLGAVATHKDNKSIMKGNGYKVGMAVKNAFGQQMPESAMATAAEQQGGEGDDDEESVDEDTLAMPPPPPANALTRMQNALRAQQRAEEDEPMIQDEDVGSLLDTASVTGESEAQGDTSAAAVIDYA